MLWKKKRKSGGDRPLFLVIRRRWLAAAGTAVMAAAIALHNVPEGMVIGAAFAGTQTSGLLPSR